MNPAASGDGIRTTFRTTAEAFAALRRRADGFPSPTDWQDEVIYQLLPDRFSDGSETPDRLLDRDDLASARPGPSSTWADDWAESGYRRFQGGTLRGVISKLDYLAELGVSTVWLGPPWKQRAESDDYHGYAVQHLLDVDPRFGTREDLVELVATAHERGLRVVLDIIVNHTGENWLYAAQLGRHDAEPPAYRGPESAPHDFGAWLDGDGLALPAGSLPAGSDDGVWPAGPLQSPDAYHRAGFGSYGGGGTAEIENVSAEFRRADWHNRDLALTDGPLGGAVLEAVVDCWTYWLELTDCDGFRIDTFKHFPPVEAQRFCGAVREYAEAMGKDNFLLLGEIGGGDDLEDAYLQRLGRNLSAALEVGGTRAALSAVARGVEPPATFFDRWSSTSQLSHRNLGDAFVYSLDDHDDLSIELERFASGSPGRTVPAVALVLFTLGIPCLYYGTEQALALPADLTLDHVRDRTDGAGGDRYVREAMFGPEHPRRPGRAGLPDAGDPTDPSLPGFGPFGTSGRHVFDTSFPTFRRIAEMLSVRSAHRTLRRGRQYLREIRTDPAGAFHDAAPGGIVAWSRILGRTEAVCVANLDPTNARSADVTVDAGLSAGTAAVFHLVLDTATATGSGAGRSAAPAGPALKVETTPEGRSFVAVPAVGPGEVLILSNDSAPR